jgi:hypothetical protein
MSATSTDAACRQEASAAGVNLRSDVERLQARLAGESASIEGLRQGVAAAAQQEAAALAGLQGQVRWLHWDTQCLEHYSTSGMIPVCRWYVVKQYKWYP